LGMEHFTKIALLFAEPAHFLFSWPFIL